MRCDTGSPKGQQRQNVIHPVPGHLLVDAEPIARGRNFALRVVGECGPASAVTIVMDL